MKASRRAGRYGAAAGVAVAIAAGAVSAAEPAGASFEDLAREAATVNDLGLLVAPFLEDCRRDKREVERTRCQTARAFLQAHLPARSFLATSPGAEVVSLSDYDARLKGFRMVVAGCLACRQPVEAGPGGEKRFVTLKTPAAGAGSLSSAVEVTRTVVPFASVAESNAWLVASRPHLRAEFVFQPANAPWTMGASRGVAFKPIGVRVFNGCTGDVVYSQPPSRGPASSGDCGSGAAVAGGRGKAAAEAAPAAGSDLGTTEINQAIATVRPDIDACLKQFKLPGTTFIAFVVAGSGIPQAVTVEGSGAGTAFGQCLVDAATRVRFPPFAAEKQTFKYPVVVRK